MAPTSRGRPDICDQLRSRLPRGWTATLLAIDGATSADVEQQLHQLPHDITHLVLSVGGNDALMHEHLLTARVASASEALLLLAGAIDDFENSYRATMQRALALGKNVVVCTIYNANIADPEHARCIRLAVALFNDVILRVASEHALATIDLRYVCTETEDFANDIEPSVQGGAKIADAIAVRLQVHASGSDPSAA